MQRSAAGKSLNGDGARRFFFPQFGRGVSPRKEVFFLRKTKIICTIGPSCDTAGKLREMIRRGMNVARLNFSHGLHAQHAATIAAVREAARLEDVYVAIMLDTKGPEIRTGKLASSPVELVSGNKIVLTAESVVGSQEKISVSYPQLPDEVRSGDHILLADGFIVLEVERCAGPEIDCRIIVGGRLGENKGVNIPGVRINMPFLSANDQADILFGVEQKVDYIAASFVRSAEDILSIRRLLEQEKADISLIAKIESQNALSRLDEIIRLSEGVMVARGDLGVEIPAEDVPLVQKDIIRQCSQAGKIVIIATQMLESMIEQPRPTRAEVSDVANAIFAGVDAIMLSGESAAGKYPLEAVSTMARVASRSETAFSHAAWLESRRGQEAVTVPDAIGYATCATASQLGARVIVSATRTGNTAKLVAKYRPPADIVAATPDEAICRKMALVWGVFPLLTAFYGGTDEIISESLRRAADKGLLHNGELTVVTGGDISGGTNLLKVCVVSDMVLSGIGLGREVVQGTVKVVTRPEQAAAITNAHVAVCYSSSGLLPHLESARGIIAEEAGLTGETAIFSLHFSIPAVIGVKDAVRHLQDGMVVTLDPLQGRVYLTDASADNK
jgi:pyruvate kinase